MVSTVPTVKIHPTGPSFSKFIYGTWRIADDSNTESFTPKNLLERLKKCISLGITTFDCADIYGGPHVCEKLVGDALALEPSIRSSIQLVTKCGIVVPSDQNPVKHYDYTYDYIHRRVNESLSALKTDYLDLLLLHRPSPMMNPDVIAKAFDDLKSKVKYFGVSNFTPSQMEMLQSRLTPKGITLVTNQIELHPLNMSSMHDGTLDFMITHHQSPMIWSPLAQGRLVQESTDPTVLAVKSALKKVANEHQATVDQIAYAWLLNHPSSPFVVLGTNKIERVETAVKSLNIQLTYPQWFSIWEAAAGNPVP